MLREKWQKPNFWNLKFQKNFWLVILILAALIYYSFFVRSIIPPQTGWWQYMAQRLNDGEMLYRDVFMYVPPYFAWLTALLYKLFGNDFILYTIFGLLFFRILPWAILYLLVVRFTKPQIASIGILFGICLTSAYLMDQPYDYNPLIMALVIIQTYLLVRIYESTSVRNIQWLTIFEGVLCGIQLMLKQNVGIIMPIVVVVILTYVIFQKDIVKKRIWYIVSFVLGIFIAISPGLGYLMYTETLNEFWWCITEALKAKTGTGNILAFAIENFVSPVNMLVACMLSLAYYFAVSKKNNAHKHLLVVVAVVSCIITLKYYSYINSLITYVKTIPYKYYLPLAVVGGVTLVGLALLHRAKTLVAFYNDILYALFIVGMLVIFAFCTTLSDATAQYFYYEINWSSLKKDILYTLLYLDIILWGVSVYKGIIKKDETSFIFVLIYTSFFGFLAVSFASASLEELYALLLTPGVFAAIGEYCEAKIDVDNSKKVQTPSILLPMTLGVCGFICTLCFLQKVYMPYEWHSWRSASLLNQQNKVVSVSVDGLEGFCLPESDAKTYEEIVNLILDNSNEDDVLYQFPNIPLFNVLTNRKSIYAAIPYFDVCPDSIAIQSAQELYEDPPELVLWANLSEGRWTIHEIVFRNGNPSGQREIYAFYQEVVEKEYTLLGVFNNNEGESLSLWKRK